MSPARRKRAPGRAPRRGTVAEERAEQIQHATYRIAEAAHTATTLEELYRAIHQIVGELMPAANFFIAEYDASRRLLTFPYFAGEHEPLEHARPLGAALADYVLRTGQPLLADKETHRLLARQGEVDAIEPPSLQWLGVPLTIGDATIGVLAVQSSHGRVRYGPAEKRVLEFVSAQVAMAIERKRAEVALRESEARLARAQEAAHLGSWELELKNLATPRANPLWWSAEVYRIFGYSPGAVAVSTELFFRSVPVADHPELVEALERSVALGVPFLVRHRVKRPEGTERVVEARASVVRDAGGRPLRMVGTVLDVTERRALEEQFLQAQKMEAVGRLAGGVAHDFNNLLTAIIGSADLLREHLGADHPERAEADEIRAAALRAAHLTRQLLAFSRQQVLQPRVLDLNRVVAGMDHMLHRVIGEDIDVRTALAPELWPVRADPHQLEQVLMNLVVNARDAMPRGGKLTIETANRDLDPAYVATHQPLAAGRYAMLAVSDTGTGMDPKTMAHIFEPFFTTKGKGQGTGLGLSTVYGIVQQSGGCLWVYSEPGVGSTFKVYLPKVEGGEERAEAEPARTAAPGGVETVLLVEDQAEVRVVSRRVLEGRGYRVLVAEHGRHALEIARAHRGRIDLLLTDVVMPGMSGRDVAEELARERPALKALFLSGYADESIVHHGVLEPGIAFLEKPFTPDALARKVREVLDAPGLGA